MEKELNDELNRLGYVFEFSMEEHPACWGKSCEGKHLRRELKIWKSEQPKMTWSFSADSNGGFDYVLERLPTLNSYL